MVTVRIMVDSIPDLPRAAKKFARSTIRVSTHQLHKNLVRRSPVKDGRLKTSWVESVNGTHGEVNSTVEHSVYVDEGTGIYGKHHTPIKPVRAKALRFVKNGQVIFTKQTKGQIGQHYKEKSIQDLERQLAAFVDEIMVESFGEM